MRPNRIRMCTVGVFLVGTSTGNVAAQQLLIIPERIETRDETLVRLRAELDTTQTAGDRAKVLNRIRRHQMTFGWNGLDHEQAIAFWGEKPARLLPGSSLALGSKSAALYSEIAGIVSGTTRFAVGTTISSAVKEQPDSAETDGSDTRVGFQRFVAGGGNLSLAATRPLAVLLGNHTTHFLYMTPRGWVNVPTLSDAENIEDLGGEIAGEYQYHRRAMPADSTPFFVVSVRGGLVRGSDQFYNTIGLKNHGSWGFWYVAPTGTFIVAEKVQLGIAWLMGPKDLQRQGRVRLNLSLLSKPSPTQ